MKRLIPLSVAAATLAFGAAYKIPEQSLNSTALAGAYVSHTTAADTAYFNPANMAFLSDSRALELNLMYIHLTPIRNETDGHETHRENFLLPQLHVVSRPLGSEGNWRLGFSVTEPGGLAKRWMDAPETWRAKKFELRVIEVNPSFSYRFSDTFAVGGGVRYIYTDGKIETEAAPIPGSLAMDLEGDGHRFGYNLAASYKATPEWGMAVTYRSKVDLKEQGRAKFYGAIPTSGLPIPAELSVPLPATLSLATDYTFNNDKTTVELEYERVYWSRYKRLTITSSMIGTIVDTEKNWNDSNTFRVGLTHRYNDDLTLMFGYAYDESPIPDETVGYELPDSDANIFSLGFRYKVSDAVDVGMAYLFDKKDSRTVTSPPNTNIAPYPSVKFTNSAAHLVSIGIGYRY